MVFLNEGKIPHYGEVLMVTSSLIKGLIISSFAHFPKRLSSESGFILSTQYRLTPPNGKRIQRTRMSHNKEFDLALKFLKIRSLADSKLVEPYEWWSNQRRQNERQSERHGHRPHPAPQPKESHSEGQNIDANQD